MVFEGITVSTEEMIFPLGGVPCTGAKGIVRWDGGSGDLNFFDLLTIFIFFFLFHILIRSLINFLNVLILI